MFEMVERRTVHSKTFDLENGQKSCRSSIRPLHYHDGSVFQEISPGWVQINPTRFQSTGLGFSVVVIIGRNSLSFQFVSQVDAGIVDGSFVAIDGVPLNLVSGLNFQAPTLTGPNLAWRNLVSDTDLSLQLQWAGLSLNHFLKSSSAPRSFDWDFTEDVTARRYVDTRIRGRENFDRMVSRPAIDSRREIEVSSPHRLPESIVLSRRNLFLRSEWTGRAVAVDPVTRIRSLTTDVSYPVWLDPSITDDITADADDGHEVGTTWEGQLTSANCYAGGRNSVGVRNGGFRFLTVDVPQGATIDSATLTFDVIGRSTPFSITIFADDVDDASAWSDSSRPSQITQTTASAALNAPATGLQSTTITSIVQEIVNRSGWAANNDMRFACLSEGAYGSGYHNVSVVDLSTWGDPDVAQLDITYTEAGGSLVLPRRSMQSLLAR